MPQGTTNRESPRYLPKSEQQIRNAARDLRRQLGIDHRYAPDLYEVLHKLHKVLPKFKLKEIEDQDLPHAEGKAHCEPGILEIPKSTLIALDKYGDPRARWTTAHEIGHIVLGHPGRLFRKRPNEPISAKEALYEREANTFASEFLSPTHLAFECSRPDDISRQFQLSSEAAVRRFEELARNRIEHATEERAPIKKDLTTIPQLPAVIMPTISRPRAFAAMAYTEKINRLYAEILKPTIEKTGLICVRADEILGVTSIADDIQHAIGESQIVIAEISEFNPNVMHEIGFAQSLEKPTIILCQDTYREYEIPSNIRHIRRIMYGSDVGSGPLLSRRLSETLETIVRFLR